MPRVTDTEQQQRNLEVVMTIAEQGLEGRWDNVRPHVAEDVVLRLPESLPWGGERRGWEGYQESLASMAGFLAEFDVSDTTFTPLDDAIVIRMNISGRIAASGKAFSMPLLEVWRLRDCKVCEITAFFFDTMAFAGT